MLKGRRSPSRSCPRSFWSPAAGAGSSRERFPREPSRQSRHSQSPSKSCKICGFHAALEDDDQPAFSYRLPVGGASGDILSDIDDHILSPSLGMCSKKVLKLLPYTGICSRRFYRFKGGGSD